MILSSPGFSCRLVGMGRVPHHAAVETEAREMESAGSQEVVTGVGAGFPPSLILGLVSSCPPYLPCSELCPQHPPSFGLNHLLHTTGPAPDRRITAKAQMPGVRSWATVPGSHLVQACRDNTPTPQHARHPHVFRWSSSVPVVATAERHQPCCCAFLSMPPKPMPSHAASRCMWAGNHQEAKAAG